MRNLLDNQLIKLIEKYPDKPWNWRCISVNKFNKDPVVRKRIEERIKLRETRKFIKDKNSYFYQNI